MIVVVDCSRVSSTLDSLEQMSIIRMSLGERNDKDIEHCAKCTQFMTKIIEGSYRKILHLSLSNPIKTLILAAAIFLTFAINDFA